MFFWVAAKSVQLQEEKGNVHFWRKRVTPVFLTVQKVATGPQF